MKNEVGKRYGRLTVLERAGTDSSKHVTWRCQCDCGNIIEARGSRLRSGEKVDCGCQKKHGFIDETNNRYGRLTVLKLSEERDKDRHIKWDCVCDCGNKITVNASSLRQGKTQSCGCLLEETRGQSLVINEVGNRYGELLVVERDKSNNGAFWLCKCSCGNYTVVKGSNLRTGNTKSCGCVKSTGEQKILSILQENQITYKKEYSFKDLVTKTGGFPRFDFAIFKEEQLLCLIEFQGEQHYKKCGKFGELQRQTTDILKKEYCNKKNIPLYFIDFNENIENKVLKILKEIVFLTD